jgi:predicted TIM-barrel fold metal-dependent hydrolase
VDAVDEALQPWWEPIRSLLGPTRLFDAHTHVGQNDPDGLKQSVEELTAGLDRIDADAAVFPMHEPDGYPPANDAVLAAAEAHPGRLFPYCRVDPRRDAAAEAKRCFAAGARGIKLHPRAERFGLDEPAVAELAALAGEHRAPMLIHAGRGIPALGRIALELTGRNPEMRLILAHAAVSDLAWLWRELPDHPNLLIDTSWWSPGDLIALFTLVPPSQIVWASDSPYGLPLTSVVMQLRFALQAGVDERGLRCIAGEQMRRILAGEELARLDRPPGEEEPLSPGLERVVAHLTGAMGAAIYEGDHLELASLALLACDVAPEDPDRELMTEVANLMVRSAELAAEEPGDERFPPSVRMLAAALAIARTPRAPGPGVPGLSP